MTFIFVDIMNLKYLKGFFILLLIISIVSLVFNVNGYLTEDEPIKKIINETELGRNDLGYVTKIGPIGNNSSDVKIAYIIGVHPSEYVTHIALYDTLVKNSDSLNYCYYIYKVEVTKDADIYEEGRVNGQLLANEFVVSDITSLDFNLVCDIHSHSGVFEGTYAEENFIFTPLGDSESLEYCNEIIAQIDHLVYYSPYLQTSPIFVTIPIIESGTPAIIFETYTHGHVNDAYD